MSIYICKACGAESPTGIGYVSDAKPKRTHPQPGCPNPHVVPTASVLRAPTVTTVGNGMAAIRTLASWFGAEVNQRKSWARTDVEVLAPDGYVWAEGMASSSLVAVKDVEGLQDLAERMCFGLERESEEDG